MTAPKKTIPEKNAAVKKATKTATKKATKTVAKKAVKRATRKATKQPSENSFPPEILAGLAVNLLNLKSDSSLASSQSQLSALSSEP